MSSRLWFTFFMASIALTMGFHENLLQLHAVRSNAREIRAELGMD